jgi:hypothetical protein
MATERCGDQQEGYCATTLPAGKGFDRRQERRSERLPAALRLHVNEQRDVDYRGT